MNDNKIDVETLLAAMDRCVNGVGCDGCPMIQTLACETEIMRLAAAEIRRLTVENADLELIIELGKLRALPIAGWGGPEGEYICTKCGYKHDGEDEPPFLCPGCGAICGQDKKKRG